MLTRRTAMSLAAVVAAAAVGYMVGGPSTVQGQGAPGGGFAAVPASIGALDVTGPYDVVADWPKDISTLPGNEKWTGGPARASSPRAPIVSTSCSAASCLSSSGSRARRSRRSARTSRSRSMDLLRNATQASPPGCARGQGQGRATTRTRARPASTSSGRTASSSSTATATSSRPGSSGTRCCGGRTRSSSAHTIRRSTCGWWTTTAMPSSSSPTTARRCCRRSAAERPRVRRQALLPSDVHGLAARRQLLRVGRLRQHARREVRQGREVRHRLGRARTPPNETRPKYFNNVHGVTVDPATRQVYVNDRGNLRIQVFDENGSSCACASGRRREPALRAHRRRPQAVGVRSTSARSSRSTISTAVSSMRGAASAVPGGALGRARHQRPGTEPVPGRSRPWRRAEVPAARRRQRRVSRRQAGVPAWK